MILKEIEKGREKHTKVKKKIGIKRKKSRVKSLKNEQKLSKEWLN